MIFLALNAWFWCLFCTELCLLTWFVEEEWLGASLASLVVFVFGIWWLGEVPVWTWVKSNPAQILKLCMVYFTAGVAWSVVKYYAFLKKAQKYIVHSRKGWEESQEIAPGYRDKTLKDYIKRYDTKNFIEFETSTKRLTFWAAFWPTSMLWTLINDPIRKFFRFLIYDVFIGIYRKMHTKMIGNFLEVMESEGKRKDSKMSDMQKYEGKAGSSV